MRKMIYDLLKDSTIIQGISTVVVITGDVILAVQQKPIPELLVVTTGAMVGFWFGSKLRVSQDRNASGN